MTNCLLLSLADPATAGLKEGKESRERALSFYLPPDSDLLLTRSLEKIPPACQYKKSRPQITDPSSTKRRQLFIGTHNETLSVRRDVRLQRRLFDRKNPLLRTQPQLQPALLRLSAMISQYFTRRILPLLHSTQAMTK